MPILKEEDLHIRTEKTPAAKADKRAKAALAATDSELSLESLHASLVTLSKSVGNLKRGITFQVSSVAEDVHAPRNSHHDRVIMSPSVGRPLELFLATVTPRKRFRAKLNPKNGHNLGERLILISKYVLIFLATLLAAAAYCCNR